MFLLLIWVLKTIVQVKTFSSATRQKKDIFPGGKHYRKKSHSSEWDYVGKNSLVVHVLPSIVSSIGG